MAYPTQDRLIRKEEALGTLRELQPPETHIGLSIAPWQEVGSDDVIFGYAKGLVDGLAPARAEDAESQLYQDDKQVTGIGRAAIIDWALKDRYAASDVTRYQEGLVIANQLGSLAAVEFPLSLTSMTEEFGAKVRRDDVKRRRRLDNRVEWLIMTAMETSGIAYNDGKIKFTVDYGRPAGQTDQAPAGGLWTLSTSDPINDILRVQEFMFDTYGVHMRRAVVSQKILNNLINSDKFAARSGLAGATGSLPIDPNYIMDGWGPSAAQAVIERQCSIKFEVYDSVYRTRPINSNTITNNRFFSEKKVLFLPDAADIDDLDDAIGFGKTLTSPHPEGNWAPGYYEWEQDTVDPWGKVRGTGVKAFPVLPHMDATYTMTVLP